MSGIADFFREFAPKLSRSNRWGAFCLIADELFKLERPVSIVETGCARAPGNWGGDGLSTLIWAYIAEKSGGSLTSVDINEGNCETARALVSYPRAQIVCSDSIKFLSWYDCSTVDFLYLDSFDFNPDDPMRAALHHVGELAAAYGTLRPGTLIAVDDCHTHDAGKHVLIDRFFTARGVKPAHAGYVTVWRKP